jgi:hypothetical protein
VRDADAAKRLFRVAWTIEPIHSLMSSGLYQGWGWAHYW